MTVAAHALRAGNPAAAAGGLPLLAYDVVYASLLAEQGLLREALAYVSAVQVLPSRDDWIWMMVCPALLV